MSEQSKGLNGANGTNGANGSATLPPLVVEAQYVKDLSFESPNALKMLSQDNKRPSINVAIDVQAQKLSDHSYEVVLDIHAEAEADSQKIFVVELSYGGLFSLNEVPDEAVRPLLLIECPRLLFPFARKLIADVTQEGGFLPLMLHPVDFVALYHQQLMKEQGGQSVDGSVANEPT